MIHKHEGAYNDGNLVLFQTVFVARKFTTSNYQLSNLTTRVRQIRFDSFGEMASTYFSTVNK